MDVLDALDRYLVQLEADGRSEHTIAQYRRHVRLLSRWTASEGLSGDVAEIDHEVVARFLSSPQARTRPDGRRKKATSTNALRSSVRTFFRYLHRAGHVAADPARLVRRARCGTPLPRALFDDEQRRLLDVLAAADGPEAERDHVLFRLMLAAGIRVGSAVALDVDDVVLERGELYLRRAKGDRPERVFLESGIRDRLGAFLRGHDSGPLFRGCRGQRLTVRHVQRRLRQWLARAGIVRPASPHSLRHSFATDLYRRTGDLQLVRKALRHRSITSTVVYAEADDEGLRRAMGA